MGPGMRDRPCMALSLNELQKLIGLNKISNSHFLSAFFSLCLCLSVCLLFIYSIIALFTILIKKLCISCIPNKKHPRYWENSLMKLKQRKRERLAEQRQKSCCLFFIRVDGIDDVGNTGAGSRGDGYRPSDRQEDR